MSILLNGLGKTLCEGINLPDVHIDRISKKENNLNTGFIEIIIPDTYISRKRLNKIVADYFSDQGYDVNRKQCMVGVMGARKDAESFWINVAGAGPRYRVSVVENYFDKGLLNLTPID